jgi:hypothetical protein
MSTKTHAMLALEEVRIELSARTRAEGFAAIPGHWSLFWNDQGEASEPRFVRLDALVENLGFHVIPDHIRTTLENYDLRVEFLVLCSYPGETVLFRVPFTETLPATIVPH